MVEYSIIEGNGHDIQYDYDVGGGRIQSADGYGFFAINLPHQGQVTVNRTLDYEKTQRYYVTIVASVIILLNSASFVGERQAVEIAARELRKVTFGFINVFFSGPS